MLRDFHSQRERLSPFSRSSFFAGRDPFDSPFFRHSPHSLWDELHRRSSHQSRSVPRRSWLDDDEDVDRFFSAADIASLLSHSNFPRTTNSSKYSTSSLGMEQTRGSPPSRSQATPSSATLRISKQSIDRLSPPAQHIPSPAQDTSQQSPHRSKAFLDDEGEEALRKLKAMKARLRLFGFEERVEIPGDGNCQFAAVSDQLYDSPKYHLDVRKAAVKWLRSNPSFKLENGCTLSDFKEERHETWDDYCDYLAKPGIWGDHLTLIALAERFRVKIVIITSLDVDNDTDPFIIVRPRLKKREGAEDDSEGEEVRTIYLSHLHELHYSSLSFVD